MRRRQRTCPASPRSEGDWASPHARNEYSRAVVGETWSNSLSLGCLCRVLATNAVNGQPVRSLGWRIRSAPVGPDAEIGNTGPLRISLAATSTRFRSRSSWGDLQRRMPKTHKPGDECPQLRRLVLRCGQRGSSSAMTAEV
jgi:hypothetical protein